MGTFTWPPAGTGTWPHTGTFSWPRTTPSTRQGRACARLSVITQVGLASTSPEHLLAHFSGENLISEHQARYSSTRPCSHSARRASRPRRPGRRADPGWQASQPGPLTGMRCPPPHLPDAHKRLNRARTRRSPGEIPLSRTWVRRVGRGFPLTDGRQGSAVAHRIAGPSAAGQCRALTRFHRRDRRGSRAARHGGPAWQPL
jgi:hypothetical protein